MKKLFLAFALLISFASFGQNTGEVARIIGALSSKILAQPASQNLAATGSVAWTVQPGGFYYLTITNAPGATTAFSATIQFECSPDGTNWSSVTGNPMTGLPGAGQSIASSTTVAGLWQIQCPTTCNQLRYRVSAYTSGTVWGYLEAQSLNNLTIQLPWTPSVTSGQTLVGWINTSGISEISIQVSAVTTTVVTAQGTDDPTGTSVNSMVLQNENSSNQTLATTYTTAGKYTIVNPNYKWGRLQVTTTGTVNTIQGVTAKFGYNTKISAGQSTVGLQGNPGVNTAQFGGTNVVNGGVAGLTGVGGSAANSGAATGNPVRIGGKVVATTIATKDATLVAGDAADAPMTTDNQLIQKQFASSEHEYNFNSVISLTTTSVVPIIPASGTANMRNFITGFTIETDAVGSAGNIYFLDGALTISSIAITTGLVTTSAPHDLKVGDAFVFTALAAGTGVSTNVVYYVTSVGSTTTFNFALTQGGSNVVPSVAYTGTTGYRVLWNLPLRTTGVASPVTVIFPNPLRGTANTPINVLVPTSLTSGSAFILSSGYRGFGL